MPVTRQIFEVNTDTGTWGDSGPAFSGAVVQLRWNPFNTADTGADLRMEVLPRQNDTGDGFTIFNDNDCLGANFTRALRQRLADSTGAADTGSGPIFAAGDRLRVKVTPGGASCDGRLYVYIIE